MRVQLSPTSLRNRTYSIRFNAATEYWELLINDGNSIEVRTIGNNYDMNHLLSETIFSRMETN